MVAINIYNITRSNRGTGDPLQMRRSGCGRHIRATSDDGDDDSGEEKDDVRESKPDNTKNVRALMKGMSKDKRNRLILALAEEADF